MELKPAAMSMILLGLFSNNALAAEATSSDKFAQVRGFKVEISGSSGKEVDTAWESVHAGILVTEVIVSGVVTPNKHPTGRSLDTGGHYFEIALQGGGDIEREYATKVARDAASGQATGRRQHLTIKPRILTGDAAADAKINVDMPTFDFDDCKLSKADAGFSEGRDGDVTMVYRCTLERRDKKAQEKYQTLSNASKARHDVALNAIRNMK